MFKYLPPERTDVLADNLICFNNPLNFNDPFEFNVSFDLSTLISTLHTKMLSLNLEESLSASDLAFFKSLPKSHQNAASKEFRKNIELSLYKNEENYLNSATSAFKEFNDNFIKITRVLSLTETPNNILMWGHYSQSHRGFVIEFDRENYFFNQKKSETDEYGFLRKVNYQKELPLNNPYSAEQISHFLTKSLDWKYECEWRMLLISTDSDKRIRIGDKIFDLYHFPTSAIKNIILGCNCSEALKIEIENIIRSRKDYSHVNILQASRSTKHFEVKIDNL